MPRRYTLRQPRTKSHCKHQGSLHQCRVRFGQAYGLCCVAHQAFAQIGRTLRAAVSMIWPNTKSTIFPASKIGCYGTKAPLHAPVTRLLFGLEWRPIQDRDGTTCKTHLESSDLCNGVNVDTVSIAQDCDVNKVQCSSLSQYLHSHVRQSPASPFCSHCSGTLSTRRPPGSGLAVRGSGDEEQRHKGCSQRAHFLQGAIHGDPLACSYDVSCSSPMLRVGCQQRCVHELRPGQALSLQPAAQRLSLYRQHCLGST